MLPTVYSFDDWRDPPMFQRSLVVQQVLASLLKAAGTVPLALDSEPLLRAFTDPAVIIVCDADIEASLIFPNRRYASRDWVRQQYLKFMGWCEQVGWLNAPASTDTTSATQPVAAAEPAVDDKSAAGLGPIEAKKATAKAKKSTSPRPVEAASV